MARYRARAPLLRLGPTNLTGGAGEQTIGTVSLATLMSGVANGEQIHVRALCQFFTKPSDIGTQPVYAEFRKTIVSVLLAAGPTYTLGSVVSIQEHTSIGAGSGVLSGMNFDQSPAGTLRLRATPAGTSLTAYAVVEVWGP